MISDLGKKRRCYERKPAGLAIVACCVLNSYYFKIKMKKDKEDKILKWQDSDCSVHFVCPCTMLSF